MIPQRDLLPIAGGRRTARVTWRLVRRRPAALTATVVSFAVAGLAGVVPVWMIGRVVDAVELDRPDGRQVILTAGAVIAVCGVVAVVAQALSAAAMAATMAPAIAELREDVLDRALHLPSARIEAAGTGDVVSRVGDDVRTITDTLDEALPAVLASAVTLAFTLGGLFGLNWRLGVAGAAAVPAYLLALRWYLPRSAPLYREERRLEGERADALVHGLQGAATLRELDRVDDGRTRITVASRAALDVTLRVFGLFTRFGFRMNMSELVGLAAVLTGGYVVVSTGVGTVGEATAAALFFHRLFNPIGALLFLFDAIQSAGAAATRLVGVRDMPREPASHHTVTAGPELRIRDVAHAYEPDRQVLEPTDLTIRPGERVAVVGATGAGKTTLGAIAAGSLRPTSGSVELGDLRISDLPEADVRDHVALVSQEVHVFAGTLRDNLVLARADATDDELRDALQRTGGLRWVDALPHGLDTIVGRHGHDLTSARTQQLALTRVLLADPALVVLDEATAEAGSSGARDLEDATEAVVAGRSALVIAHRLSQAEHADRVVVMADGQVVEQGTHAELVTAGGRYAELWRAWSTD